MPRKTKPHIVAQKDHYADRDFVMKDEWFVEKTSVDEQGVEHIEPPVPHYGVAEAAKFFFGKSADWLRWRSKKTEQSPNGFFTLDGNPLPDRRGDFNFRYYTLADIEKMAHALAQNGAIDGGRLETIITLVKAEAKLYGHL
jgi:hypothetical protein